MYIQIDVQIDIKKCKSKIEDAIFPHMSGCTILHCTCVRLYSTLLYRCQAVLFCSVQVPGCSLLYCTGARLYFTVLYRGQLYFGLSHSFLCLAASNKVIATALHCTTPHCTTLHYTTLYYTALDHTALHCTTPQYTTLHYFTVDYTALH